MPKVRNTAAGIYADGEIYVAPGEVIEVSEAKADYLCAEDTAGKFERVRGERATDRLNVSAPIVPEDIPAAQAPPARGSRR